ncbi:uncharacterized protein LOC133832207 [Humulus lupulus]|uniref:uncharacterized protein LOC133832207 n=1 Tax=Humulus lupulus TaxID=3486 RepID=UPI002B40C2A7|nr:uncharacterized protein LOC133832207 [Humulus lupulus]
MPNIDSYNGGTDPPEYLSKFNKLMLVHIVSEDAKCHIFPLTLTGSTDEWFKKHKLGSIHSLHQLPSSFKGQFIASRKVNFKVNDLANLKQGPLETLKAYIKCFKEEAAKTKRVNDGQQLMDLQDGIQFNSAVQLAGFTTMLSVGFGAASTAYGAAPTGYNAFHPIFSFATAGLTQFVAPSKTPSGSKQWGKGKGKKSKRTGATLDEKYTPQYSKYTDLVDTQEKIFLATKQQAHYRKPPPMRRDREKRDSTKFYRFDNYVGHRTNECRKIKMRSKVSSNKGTSTSMLGSAPIQPRLPLQGCLDPWSKCLRPHSSR